MSPSHWLAGRPPAPLLARRPRSDVFQQGSLPSLFVRMFGGSRNTDQFGPVCSLQGSKKIEASRA